VEHEYYEEHFKGFGSIESRLYWLNNDLQCIGKKERWAGLKTIGMAESEKKY
jgi:hypothetical protein